MQYDAAIIGAGGDAMAAAIVAAGAGLKTVVVAARPGGLFGDCEFHPGFRAPRYVDTVAPIPRALFQSFDLARHGAVLAPAPASLALWPDDVRVIGRGEGAPAAALLRRAGALAAGLLGRAGRDAVAAPPRFAFLHRDVPPPWPGSEWAALSLDALLGEHVTDPRLAAHALAVATTGRAADPFLAGSALHLLAAGAATVLPCGPAGLAAALEARARTAGAELRFGLEPAEIRRKKGHVAAIALADGSEIETRAVISTLDVKQTFLSFFAWNELPKEIVARVSVWRSGGGTARLLLALDAPPDLAPFAARSTLHVAPEPARMAEAYAAWRAGQFPTMAPVSLRLPSALDPRLAPPGKAVLTATLGAIPYALFDGGWTHDKRVALCNQALAAIEAVLPGTAARVLGSALIVPPDIEAELGATAGDLWGGEIAADQMFGFRPWLGLEGASACAPPRTPIDGLYLAGPSTPAGVSASCVSGALAAGAVLADLKAGRLG